MEWGSTTRLLDLHSFENKSFYSFSFQSNSFGISHTLNLNLLKRAVIKCNSLWFDFLRFSRDRFVSNEQYIKGAYNIFYWWHQSFNHRFFISLVRTFCIERIMFNKTATDLTTVSTDVIQTWLKSFDTVLSDCDGEILTELVWTY